MKYKTIKSNLFLASRFLPVLIIFSITFIGCKPTEKGYKAAYDAALSKREAAMETLDVDLPAGALQQVDGPQLKVVDGQQVYVFNQRLKPIEEFETLPGNYNVAVACYKMPTNCKAQSQDLKKEGFQAFPAKGIEDKYYTIAGSFPSMEEAIKFSKEYENGKNRVYVGLPDAPVIIYSPK